MTSREPQPAASAEDASRILTGLEDGAWAVAGFMHLVRSGALTTAGLNLSSAEDEAAARTLAALGLVIEGGDRLQLAPGMGDLCASGVLDTAASATMSSLRQLANVVGILPTEDAAAWAMVDDATLLAQGRSSEFAGRMFATVGVPSLDGLAERFSQGGTFLDVGVGVGGLACAFSECLPAARVVGLDVLPRALDLARRIVADRGLADRVELRLQAVQDLGDVEQFDLAWLPAPFLPEDVFAPGVVRVCHALRHGGWLLVGAGRFDGSPLAVAVTRWKTLRAGGTPLAGEDAATVLEGAGLVDFRVVPTPPPAPALYAARRP